MSHPVASVVVCADKLRAMLLDGYLRTICFILFVNAILFAIGSLFDAHWLQAVWILIVMGFIVAPKLIRQHRCLAELPCPSCGRQVGGYFTRNSRIHLRCSHCGKESPTDCGISAMGGIPYKIVW